MNICFLMYPWDTIDPENDTSLALIKECVKRNHGVAICTPANLTIRNSVTNAFCTVIGRMEKVPASLKAFYKKATTREEMLPLAGFDTIFFRANPPLDPIMLNFLDSVKDDVFIINSIEGMREANNKLYTAAFGDAHSNIIPNTHVSKNKNYLIRQIKESKSDKMIIKPLNGFGGSGVILIEKSAMSNINSLLDFYINSADGTSNYVILQDYIEGAEQGDVRILMLNGEPIGAMKRVPGSEDHRSNVSAGGSVQKHSLTKAEKALCKQIGPKLVKDGLYFVGIDVIGGKLVEVNVMSPGGITYINKVYKNKYKVEEKVIDFLESKVLDNVEAFNRRSRLRKKVEDA
ncbi:MAG: glutathione synthase [Xanthomarina sp.]|uniref:Glutathione synthetase n=1 Tax=Xanthomarina gelatinilytica TaxID=1137281 RepID=M7MDW5_9FLAO|nr:MULTISPECIES: glutathione synthase [Flavobacteriaceae]EMQ94352.1 Glutathione synthetase [Xanthomarina gelatinilytica]MAL23479.1 glutathione synthase [Xanthomarina sp.]MBF61213.1 glutathione synthase [Xanthomarina sp.]HAI19978.1 glutathione synthase [Xanthomarina gelatinilytica]HCY83298.1 glutathione synthase [Xanthomarina gelatinilytica]